MSLFNAHVLSLVKPVVHSSLVKAIPSLVDLAASCGWSHYGPSQWEFLINAGCNQGWLVRDDSDESVILGCLLRSDFPDSKAVALGMMLVSPSARGMGLGKAMMKTAIDSAPEDHRATPIVLGMATEMGAPMYEKLGYVIKPKAAVTRMHVEKDVLQAAVADSSVTIEVLSDIVTIGELDFRVTGLDRSRALRELFGTEGAKVALARDSTTGKVVGGAMSILGLGGGTVVGPLHGELRSALPLLGTVLDCSHGVGAMSLNAIGVKGDGGIVDALIAAGFEVDAELVSMTYEGHELPGERGLYLGLMHPTLG
ncbi:hypothetical protein TrVE_jg3822 [Triparma verrucosa]|uniref:N-acetyltransferase domain-containing protein n=1 Tax=Triparma verrucosa TaxID=1606542 RepID=A0A9W7F930_9STRA|nr:hypothetical protein TrVE_jg3822 [Triparma verrucosa]